MKAQFWIEEKESTKNLIMSAELRILDVNYTEVNYYYEKKYKHLVFEGNFYITKCGVCISIEDEEHVIANIQFEDILDMIIRDE